MTMMASIITRFDDGVSGLMECEARLPVQSIYCYIENQDSRGSFGIPKVLNFGLLIFDQPTSIGMVFAVRSGQLDMFSYGRE